MAAVHAGKAGEASRSNSRRPFIVGLDVAQGHFITGPGVFIYLSTIGPALYAGDKKNNSFHTHQEVIYYA